MTEPRVPLADVRLDDGDIEVVTDTLRSGWLSMGPRTQALEEAFAGFVGTEHALATSSGTAALHLMSLACELGPGDEVIVPSLTFVATVNCVAYAQATPVFADIAALERPWITAETVEPLITPRTKAVIAMPYGGHPGGTAELAELAADRGILFLEDAAHALGATASGRRIGSFGRAACFSFFSNKNLAVGEGGMLATDDPDLAARVRSLRSHGMTTLSWDRHRGHATSYDVPRLGFNYRFDEPRAALALRKLTVLDEGNAARAAVDSRYRAALDGRDGLICPSAPPAGGDRSAVHIFPLLLPAGTDRDAFRRTMLEAGIQTSVHYPPVHLFPVYHDAEAALPVTEDYALRTVTLPMFPHLSDEQIELVVETVPAALREARSA